MLMHGQMRPRSKQEAMAAFAEGGADVLVATTVIEVGIDVPNATVMLVEDAERYGLSQLHQLRGRIGRGEHESLCLLFGPKDSRRLRAMHEHRDGFKLAEIDLELRGEGEMLGVRQSGLQAFRFARLPEDIELLERARRHAREILDADPALRAPGARAARGRDPPHVRRRRARAYPRLTNASLEHSTSVWSKECQEVVQPGVSAVHAGAGARRAAGRVDLALEIPLPDAAARARLLRLYAAVPRFP